MTCRIDRVVIGPGLILHISGHITGKDVDLLRSLLEQERSVVAIDLKDVLLVDREAVKLLALSDWTTQNSGTARMLDSES